MLELTPKRRLPVHVGSGYVVDTQSVAVQLKLIGAAIRVKRVRAEFDRLSGSIRRACFSINTFSEAVRDVEEMQP